MREELSEELMEALVTGDHDPKEWQTVVEGEDEGHYKHDITIYSSVFKRLADNTFWQVHYLCSYNEGLLDFGMESAQVEPVEVVKTKWKVVK